MANFRQTTRQETVLIRGSIIAEGSDYYWVVDESGNRIAVCWRKQDADRIADALSVLEDIEAQNGR